MISDSLWEVIKQEAEKFHGITFIGEMEHKTRERYSNMERIDFDGGAFFIKGNEFSLYVLPERRGKWKMRTEIKKCVSSLIKRYGKATVRVDKRNSPSLRLALGFGFTPFKESDGVIWLEAM